MTDDLPAAIERPSSVRVGPFVYSIRDMTEIEFHRDNLIGFCDKKDLEIAIWPDMHRQKQAEVLFHEIFHACWNAGGLDGTHDRPDEEKVVVAFGLQFLQVVRDNPDVLAWVKDSFA
ncbi:hypothetical protein [uncultured Methylobacterium sp.]|jgi:hypothetical protein|uniref:hypothetical protein n=1 Tax=uncultured Methylobacterium sp. TaxID=157278 RepID=UPI00260FA563|nr:hypothetical protein [uncultured Methylobacterium sp.]